MANAKLKVRGGVKKRFRVTGSGKIKRRKANHTHILTKKNGKRKRKLTTGTYVSTADEKRIEKLLA